MLERPFIDKEKYSCDMAESKVNGSREYIPDLSGSGRMRQPSSGTM